MNQSIKNCSTDKVENLTFLKETHERYGLRLADMTVREKLYIIQELARDLSLRASGGIRKEVHHIQYDLVKYLEHEDKEELIEIFIAQVKK